jgi:hypothetical protein
MGNEQNQGALTLEQLIGTAPEDQRAGLLSELAAMKQPVVQPVAPTALQAAAPALQQSAAVAQQPPAQPSPSQQTLRILRAVR